MSSLEFPQPDQNLTLDAFLSPYFAQYHRERCYPGLLFRQGKRQMIQINVPAHDLPTLLQAKPSTGNDPDSGKNRPEVKGHAEEIKGYIRERVGKNKPWILGTLTANIHPDDINIIELGRDICLVIIPRKVKLDITDGQHRKRAIHELIVGSESELISDNNFPITLVLEDDFNQCQTDFRDMAQTRQLDQTLLKSFGEFEGQVGITKVLQTEVPMFRGKTEKIKSAPATKQKLIYTTNYIAKFVSCAFANDPNDELKNIEVEPAARALIKALNQFFSESIHTRHIFEKDAQELTVVEVSDFKENCLLGRSVGLEILGRLLYFAYDRTMSCFLPEKVRQISNLDWSKSSHVWEGTVVLSSYNPPNVAKSYKITASANAVRLAVSSAKSHLGWN
ncbi:DNA sulfur modification protein DndB [Desertifilum sp. FACHB-1129]|uniref:DGQHR domain-containing protein n=2 Tax=Desertifilum tharense IPPAS B-1220 TaxID=1781255 RepID=A0A1E5QCY7_9CYAN|nr:MULTISPECIES: DNA sulfur modification protein DndB [Desertifilum]MDA0212870.1 DNA sulfur modification protein DndB [Cyanobacteria bacterium FC1]MBD2311427.1 DNA sulfur modification protein DndB [Desertifilum sp. FACHB-1129]MBD2321673.1 DNA sulfur modification protein DndB [Desertifilum sp. FACHB-866]MBD2331800.1 DNA sulfur modification protein DndB [Desertifilum sp. FACHB-868]OEJ72530.1 hypothetical protein BH720_23795 [Desertifilum tharense IPPAS B-1220]